MKKFYASLGMMMTFGMAAASFPNVSTLPVQSMDLQDGIKSIQRIASQKAPAKISSVEEAEGSYMFMYYSQLTSNTNRMFTQSDIQIVPTSTPGEVELLGLNYLTNVRIKATVDVAAGTLSIPNRQLVASAADYGLPENVYLIHYKWNDAGDGTVEITTPMVGTITDEGIEFNQQEMLALWMPDSDRGYMMGAMISMPKRPSSLDNEGWVDAGTATISNSWFQNYYEISSAEYTVKYQKSTEDENIIRLLDPFGKGTPYESVNLSNAAGEVIIDLTEPNCVAVNRSSEQVVGYWQDGTEVLCVIGTYPGLFSGNQTLYPGNIAGFYVYDLGFTADDVLGEFPDEEWSTYAEGVITITDALFGTSGDIAPVGSNGMPGYTAWAIDDNNSIYVNNPIIKLGDTAVDTLGAEDLNAPVRYYNLQGVEIANPAKGQLVIKKQGNKAEKFIAE